MEFEIFFKSDLGKVRETNEDTVVVDAEKKIFAICDGFGESSFGKIASSMSSETLLRYFGNGARNKRPAIDPALNYDAIDLVTAIHLANLRLYNFVDKYIDYYGMGSTIASLYLNNGYMYVGHVGDSRVYLYRDGKLELLTTDHSYVNEMIKMGRIKADDADRLANKHFITRSLGMAETIRVDLNIRKLQKNDLFLLCSDGLNHQVPDDKIQAIMRDNDSDLNRMCGKLVSCANDMGGEDDISTVAVRVKNTAVSSADASLKEGVVCLSDPHAEIISIENGLLEELFGKDLYPEEIKVS